MPFSIKVEEGEVLSSEAEEVIAVVVVKNGITELVLLQKMKILSSSATCVHNRLHDDRIITPAFFDYKK